MERDEVAERIDAERLDASHSEWERHERVRRVILAALEDARASAVLMVGAIEGIREVLSGDWLRSPKEMRAVRAPEERTDAAQD